MSARTGEATHPSPATGSAPEARSPGVPYLRYGIPAGIVGAAVVALFFLVVDLAAGRPLATPNALGATLFLGDSLDLSRDPGAAMVLGYTAIHAVVFIAMGCLGALAITTTSRPGSPAVVALALTGVFFVFCEAVFLGFALFFGFPVASELGLGRVAAANLLAAGGMGLLLARVAPAATRPSAREVVPRQAARRREDEIPPIDPRELQSPPSGREGPGEERS